MRVGYLGGLWRKQAHNTGTVPGRAVFKSANKLREHNRRKAGGATERERGHTNTNLAHTLALGHENQTHNARVPMSGQSINGSSYCRGATSTDQSLKLKRQTSTQRLKSGRGRGAASKLPAIKYGSRQHARQHDRPTHSSKTSVSIVCERKQRSATRSS